MTSELMSIGHTDVTSQRAALGDPHPLDTGAGVGHLLVLRRKPFRRSPTSAA
ncbi:hypothetical protein [Mycobacterium interjectum]|uniref:hypothetical protein n=1 Tax=Mycobacterium interjectum TaxID=33895 RepID=UPI000A65BF98|nr:hypothetical protein [Mycobacterium interjectum]MCV7091947.1 hypothetical protein [Mycobacterium interjectum]